MAQGKTIVTIAAVIVIAGLLQVILVFADCKNTPSHTALEFTKAYYQFDPSMAEWLCQEVIANEEADPVGDYLYRSAEEARSKGYALGSLKSTLSHIETETVFKNDNAAEVHIKAVRRQASNPVFAWVARLFFLGEPYAVEKTVEVINEGGKWKVCGRPFSFSA